MAHAHPTSNLSQLNPERISAALKEIDNCWAGQGSHEKSFLDFSSAIAATDGARALIENIRLQTGLDSHPEWMESAADAWIGYAVATALIAGYRIGASRRQ